ncbi:MAG: hypothetical protein WC208_05195 [Gallionella sp.]|jgi:hypothetical protein
MKHAVIVMLLVFGVSGSVFACDGSGHSSKSGTSAPATPAPAK